MRSSLPTLALLVVLCAGSSLAQRSDPFFAQLPFAQWTSETTRQPEIPWKLRLASAGLTAYQRVLALIHIDIDGHYLAQRRGEGNVFALVQITDSDGRVYQDHSELPRIDNTNKAVRELEAFFDWRMFVLPGHYSVDVAIFDKATGKHAFALDLWLWNH
ncbi:MAG TPA: hypothetical protein VI488_01825 [Candidatus Angelobacter sp.]